MWLQRNSEIKQCLSCFYLTYSRSSDERVVLQETRRFTASFSCSRRPKIPYCRYCCEAGCGLIYSRVPQLKAVQRRSRRRNSFHLYWDLMSFSFNTSVKTPHIFGIGQRLVAFPKVFSEIFNGFLAFTFPFIALLLCLFLPTEHCTMIVVFYFSLLFLVIQRLSLEPE